MRGRLKVEHNHVCRPRHQSAEQLTSTATRALFVIATGHLLDPFTCLVHLRGSSRFRSREADMPT